MSYLYFLLFAISAVCIYIYMYKDNSLRMKMINSAVFVAAGLLLLLTRQRYTSPYAWLLFAGLLLSFIGDYTLGFDAFGMKGLPGIVSFAAAHILYICAFLTHTPPTHRTLLLLLPWAAIVAFFTWLGKIRIGIDFKGTGPAVLVYAMIITVMVLTGIRTGIFAALQGGLQTVQGLVACIAVVSFMISDCGVCLHMFGDATTLHFSKKVYSLDRFSSLSYFGAQMLIAACIAL